MDTVNIKWSNDAKIDKYKVEELQNKWGIKFPQEYVQIVLSHDGSTPYVKDTNDKWKPGLIKITENNKEWFTLLPLQIVKRGMSMIEFCYEASKEALPDNVFPFADNGAGDSFVFDYRGNKVEPNIFLLEHDREITEDELSNEELAEKPLEEWQNEALKYVASSFSDLLSLIVPRQD